MVITKDMLVAEAQEVINKVYGFPEVREVCIKGIRIPFCDAADAVRRGVNKGYHDIRSDVDIKVFVKLPAEDMKKISDRDFLYTRYFEPLTDGKEILGAYAAKDTRTQEIRESLRVCFISGVKLDISYIFEEAWEEACVSGDSGIKEGEKADVSGVKEVCATGESGIKEGENIHDRRLQDKFWMYMISAITKLTRSDFESALQYAGNAYEILETEFYSDVKSYKIEFSDKKDYNLISTEISGMAELFDKLVSESPYYDNKRLNTFMKLWRYYDI